MFIKATLTVAVSSIALLLGGALHPSVSQASETDAFTFRYTSFESGVPAISAEVNRRIQEGLKKANHGASCSYDDLESALKKQFLRPLYGKVEGWLNDSPTVPKLRVPLEKSVYRYIPSEDNIPVHLGMMGFGSVIRDGKWLVGSDKFGHFFDEGFHYYELMRDKGQTLDEAMNYGDDTENGIFGLVTTGVKSYGDMTTNFNGAHFWSDMLMPVMVDVEAHPYVECQVQRGKRRWVQVRTFDFQDYIDPAWDEGINCNQYRNATYEALVNKAINQMEAATGKPYQCPVFPEECDKAKTKYGKYAERLLHPKCLNH